MTCYVCLLHQAADMMALPPVTPKEAVTSVAGTAVCAEHITHLANHLVMSAYGMQSLPQPGGTPHV